MSHRALVAYERRDGRYDVHTARWGGLDCRLARAITATDPYAGGEVDPVPRVLSRPFECVLTMVDLGRHEALYRVRAGYRVTTFLPLWVELAHYLGERPDDGTEHSGVLVAVETPGEARELRRWLRAAKATLAEGVRDGVIATAEARTILDRALRRRVDGRELFEPGASRTDEY